jgi:sulfur transfer complex TusBCD TusB component (DsrH family)
MLIQVLSKRFDLVEPYINSADTHFVLLQEGVYLLPQLMSMLEKQPFPSTISILENDWLVSGLAHQKSFNSYLGAENVDIISNETWVALCAEHLNVMTVQA